MTAIAFPETARKTLVVHHPKPNLDLCRYRRRWVQSRFGISAGLAGVLVLELARAGVVSNARGTR